MDSTKEFEEKLIDYFYWLAFQGKGSDVRGQNLLALYILEFLASEAHWPKKPFKNPHRWLASIFNITAVYQKFAPKLYEAEADARKGSDVNKAAYENRITEVKKAIGNELGKTWGSFLQGLKNKKLEAIATLLKKVVEEHLFNIEKCPYFPYSQKNTIESNLEKLPLTTIFFYLPELKKEEGKPKELHCNARDNIKKIDTNWCKAIQKMQGEKLPHWYELIAYLPPVGEQVIDLIYGYLVSADLMDTAENKGLQPFNSFALFYALATDVASGDGRRWLPEGHYLLEGFENKPNNEETKKEFEKIKKEFDKERKGKYDAGKLKSLGMARLGASKVLTKVIALLDSYLVNGEQYPQLHAHKTWLELVKPLEEDQDYQGKWLNKEVLLMPQDSSIQNSRIQDGSIQSNLKYPTNKATALFLSKCKSVKEAVLVELSQKES